MNKNIQKTKEKNYLNRFQSIIALHKHFLTLDDSNYDQIHFKNIIISEVNRVVDLLNKNDKNSYWEHCALDIIKFIIANILIDIELKICTYNELNLLNIKEQLSKFILLKNTGLELKKSSIKIFKNKKYQNTKSFKIANEFLWWSYDNEHNIYYSLLIVLEEILKNV